MKRDGIVWLFISKGMTKEDAEDMAQDTFLSLERQVSNGRKFENSHALLKYIRMIANSKFIDFHRKRSRGLQVEYIPDYLRHQREDSSIEDDLVHEESIDEVIDLLMQMHEPHRKAYVLHTAGGMSYKEMAKVYNVSVNTALGWVRYARVKLKNSLNG